MPNSSTFAPNSFFFTDPAAISQAEDQAFGPVSADEYRLTSKFTVAADTNAYAICTGVVLVQPQDGKNDLVNLILRPFKQPITGLNIKYFVYRGLSIGDFFDSTNTNVIAADSNTSDFINKINASFAAFYTSTGQTVPPFLAKYIGFDEASQPDSMLISDLFFKIASYTSGTEDPHAFELPLINAGASLGQFVAGECGIDVVLDYGDYQLPTPNDQFIFDLAYARNSEASIDLTSETDDFKKKLLKEQIFQFLDIAAYYGFHYGNGVVLTGSSSSPTKNKGDAIYALIENFNTSDNLYLYIQSDRTRSYNFYGNYQISDTDTNNLKIGDAEDALNEVTYGTNGWPLMIINAPDGITDTSSSLFLQFVTDNNDNAVFYGQVAQVENSEGNNFCGSDDLQLPDNSDGTVNNFTRILELSNPVTGTDGSKTYVATFNMLIYQGKVYDYVVGRLVDDNGVSSDAIGRSYFLNDIFGNIEANPLFVVTETNSNSLVADQRIRVIGYNNNVQHGVSAIEINVVKDSIDDNSGSAQQRVSFISVTTDLLTNAISSNDRICVDTASSPSISGSLSDDPTYSLPDPFYFDFTTFTDDTTSINGIIIKTTDGSIPNKVFIGITKDESDLLVGLVNSSAGTNSRLTFINFSDTYFTSTENVNYYKFSLGIVYEDQNGKLILSTPSTPVTLYSLDNFTCFSNGYSQYMSPDLSDDKGDINDSI